MKHKSEEDSAMTEKEYKAYYEKGYKTDISSINIKGDNITFEKNGKKVTGTYKYVGKKILDYKKGNRGVRFIFKLTNDDTQELPKYVQFSDHNIAPKKVNISISLWVITMIHYLKKWIIGQLIILPH